MPSAWRNRRLGNDSSSKFVADAASVRQQIPIVICTDAGSVGHDRGNLELLNERLSTCTVIPGDGLPGQRREGFRRS